MMEIIENILLSERMYSIRFANKRYDHFYRNCVFPINFGLDQVEKYIVDSLNILKDTLKIVDSTNVLIMDGFKHASEEVAFTFIDAHWTDAEQYIVELKDTNKVEYITLITNVETELAAIKQFVKTEFPNTEFTIDYYDEAWVVKP